MGKYDTSVQSDIFSDIYTQGDLDFYWIRNQDNLESTSVQLALVRGELKFNKYASERTLSAALQDYVKDDAMKTRDNFYKTYTFTRSMATAIRKTCKPETIQRVSDYVCAMLGVPGEWESLLKEVADAEPVLWQRMMQKAIEIASTDMAIVCYDENLPGYECVVVKRVPQD